MAFRRSVFLSLEVVTKRLGSLRDRIDRLGLGIDGVHLIIVLIMLLLWFCSWEAMAQVSYPPVETLNQGRRAAAITPADNTPLALGPTRAIYIGSAAACALAVILADDTTAVTFGGIPAGTFVPLRARVIMATNTTCTGIVGLW